MQYAVIWLEQAPRSSGKIDSVDLPERRCVCSSLRTPAESYLNRKICHKTDLSRDDGRLRRPKSLLGSGRRLVRNLPESGPNQAKSDGTVQVDGWTVLGGSFQKDAAQAGGLKADQRLQDECSSKTLPAVIRANADILHGAGIATVGQALNCSTVDGFRIRFFADSSDQPRGLRQERSLTGNFEHQSAATFQRRQRRKDLRIQLASEAVEFRDSVTVEVFGFPIDETISNRQFRIRNVVLRKIKFHSESTEIPHDHSNAA